MPGRLAVSFDHPYTANAPSSSQNPPHYGQRQRSLKLCRVSDQGRDGGAMTSRGSR